MRVHIWQSDKGGSGFYRVTEVARAANAAGLAEVTVSDELDIEGERTPEGETWVFGVQLDTDVLVVQRPTAQGMYETARQARAQGIALVVELDDDFHRIHPQNTAGQTFDGNDWNNPKWLLATSRLADAVTVSTPLLCKYARTPAHAAVVPNYLPERIANVRNRQDRLPTDRCSIGWTGTVQTHPTDLQRTGRALITPELTDHPFIVIGDGRGIERATGRAPSVVIPWTDTVPEYWEAIRRHIDVGIVPLDPSSFNKAKSWLKGLEFASLGIPFVASPLNEYRALLAVLDPTGQYRLLAASGGQWRARLGQLVNDAGYRRDVSEDFVENSRHLTLEQHAGEWATAWQLALDNRRIDG